MRWRIGSVLVVLLLGLSSGWNAPRAQPLQPDAAKPVVSLRSGDHPSFGRIVLDLPSGVSARVRPGENRVAITIEGGVPGAVADLRRPRNVTALATDGDRLEIVSVPGAMLRTSRLSGRLVIDFVDAAANPSPASVLPSSVPKSPHTVIDPTRGRSGDARYRSAEDAIAASRTPPPVPTSPSAHDRPAAPRSPAVPTGIGIAATSQPAVAAVTLPFPSTAGAAAFRRGDAAMVVFDERRPIDLAPLRDNPVFRGAAVTLLPAGTLLRVPLTPGRQIRLKRADSGWMVVAVEKAPPPEPARGAARLEDGRLFLPVDTPGQVVAIPDPLSGTTLLVGTQRAAGHGSPVERRAPEFELLATWQGVAVMPRSDTLALRPQVDGFAITSGSDRVLAIAGSDAETRATAEAAHASRRFDIAALSVEALHRRLQAAKLAAATAPTQARSIRRREVAEALLALGLGAEMQAVMEVLAADAGRTARRGRRYRRSSSDRKR
jgi:hypothetical protein